MCVCVHCACVYVYVACIDRAQALDIADEALSCHQTSRPLRSHLPLLLRFCGELIILIFLGKDTVQFGLEIRSALAFG